MIDVLDRLQNANPVPDLATIRAGVSPLPNFADRPDQGPGRRRPMPRLTATVALACVLLVAGVPVLHNTDEGAPIDIASAIADALAPRDSILHVTLRTNQTGPDVMTETTESHLWLAPDGRAGRARTTAPDGSVTGDAPINAATDELTVLDPITAARRQLQDGSLVGDGTELISGRKLDRYVGNAGETTWYFDPESHQPVRIVTRPADGRGRFIATIDVVGFERLDDTESNRRLLTPTTVIQQRPNLPSTGQNAPTRTNPASTRSESP